MTNTITNPAAVRRLIVGMSTRAEAVRETSQWGRSSVRTKSAAAHLDTYVEAAHIALVALGCNVPPAPFGLRLLVQEKCNAAGARPPLTSPTAVRTWRAAITDSIYAALEG